MRDSKNVRRRFRVPMNDESALRAYKLLREHSGHVVQHEPDPDKLLYTKIIVIAPRNFPIPTALAKYAHDYDAWQSVGRPGYLEDIEYKITSKGVKKACATLKYRGTVDIYPGCGFRETVHVEGGVAFEGELPEDKDEICAAIREDIGFVLDEKIREGEISSPEPKMEA